MIDVSIIIVSYNTIKLTLECISSIQTARGSREIFVVDNASSDESAAVIQKKFPDDVHLIANTVNRGFGPANNQALKLCRGRYVILLNPDATIKENTLQNAVSFMDQNPHIGLAGAKILNPDGTLQESISHRYPGEKYTTDETKHLKGNIACVLGAFMIAPRQLLDELNGFDEDFFLYGEDQDLAWRIREKGFSIGYIESAHVFHWGGQSEKATAPAVLFQKKLQAEFLFYKKHYQPHTIECIRKAQVRKALYRLFILKLQRLFTPESETLNNKILNYRMVLDMFHPR